MVKQKIIKIKVGEIYINGRNESVWQTFWRKESKKGQVYYEAKVIAFPGEVEKKEFEKQPKVETEDI